MTLETIHLPITRLTDPDAHAFFGYYDVPAFSMDGRKHLCHRVGFMDRDPRVEDRAVLGTIDLATRAFTPVAETTAWNFQQGAMLQWHPTRPEAIIYNRRDGDRFVGVVRDLDRGAEQVLSRPVATVDPGGRFALSINFSRVLAFRKGYGYAGVSDPGADVTHPADDGVFRVDLATGESRLLLSYAEMRDLLPEMAAHKIVVNHITVNPDGSGYLMLVRDFREGTIAWGTAFLTADLDGGAPRVLAGNHMVSHYHWRDPEHIVTFAGLVRAQDRLYLVDARTGAWEMLDPDFFTFDGHCSYSPDRNWLLYDSYPFHDKHRHLYLYDLRRGQAFELAAFLDDHPWSLTDIRCDLHPRWDRTGRAISFDSTHEGFRAVYYVDVSSLTR
jgi:hypothetical protein